MYDDGKRAMADDLTTSVKEELCRVEVKSQNVRIAEIAAMIRFAGELSIVANKPVLEVELEVRAAAERLRRAMMELFDIRVSLLELGATSSRKAARYLLRITDDVEMVIRRVGLVTRSGQQVRGLPPQVVSGTVDHAEAAWRGAFLASGQLGDPMRSSGLEVNCPGQETSLALVGCARGVEKGTIRDGQDVGALLARMGAHVTRMKWDEKRLRRETRPANNRLANFDDANLRRSARAAVTAAARVNRAMEILGDDVPDHLAEAGQLRVKYQQASLEELGRLAEPQLTKDAVAGRIRRLLSMADKRAKELGIADTHAEVTEQLLADNEA